MTLAKSVIELLNKYSSNEWPTKYLRELSENTGE